MKVICILCLFCSTLLASAQSSTSTTKTISDNGKTLQLNYEVIGSGKNISYKNEFDVIGWSKEQKDKMVSRIIDSLENTTANQQDFLHKRIDDNGETLTLIIEGRKKGKTISYNKSFPVKGMNQAQKNALIDDVLKSLSLTEKQD